MRLKRLIYTLGFCAVFLSRTDAQGQWCFEAVGYFANRVTVPPGYSLISDPLVHVASGTYGYNQNQVSNLFPRMPIGTRLYKYDSQTGRILENRFGRRGWKHPAETLAPGEGAIIFNPSRQSISVDFSGYNTASGQIHLRRGLSLVGNRVSGYGESFIFPLAPWSYCSEPFPVEDGDIIFTFNRTLDRFETHRFRAQKGWDSYPNVGQNESFWIFTRHPRVIPF